MVSVKKGVKGAIALHVVNNTYSLSLPPVNAEPIKISPDYLYSCTHVSLAGVIVLLIRNTLAF